MTSKLSSLTAAAARTWTAGNKIPAQWMQADVAGAAAWTLGGQGNRPFMQATNTTGIATITSTGADFTFDNVVADYDSSFTNSDKATFTAGTAGWYNVNVSSFAWSWVNSCQFNLLMSTTISATTTNSYVLSFPHTIGQSQSTGSTILYPSFSTTVKLNAGDSVKFRLYSTAATSSSVPNSSGATTNSPTIRPTLTIAWVSA